MHCFLSSVQSVHGLRAIDYVLLKYIGSDICLKCDLPVYIIYLNSANLRITWNHFSIVHSCLSPNTSLSMYLTWCSISNLKNWRSNFLGYPSNLAQFSLYTSIMQEWFPNLFPAVLLTHVLHEFHMLESLIKFNSYSYEFYVYIPWFSLLKPYSSLWNTEQSWRK